MKPESPSLLGRTYQSPPIVNPADMERIDEMTTSRIRSLLGGVAGPLEVVGVAATSIVVWLSALGWDWSLVRTSPWTVTNPQSGLDWAVLGVAALLGVGWLALRGRAVLGTVAVCVPIILLSGWRLAAAGLIGWPTDLASLVFSLSATCMLTALIGAWLRHRDEARRREAGRDGVQRG